MVLTETRFRWNGAEQAEAPMALAPMLMHQRSQADLHRRVRAFPSRSICFFHLSAELDRHRRRTGGSLESLLDYFFTQRRCWFFPYMRRAEKQKRFRKPILMRLANRHSRVRCLFVRRSIRSVSVYWRPRHFSSAIVCTNRYCRRSSVNEYRPRGAHCEAASIIFRFIGSSLAACSAAR